MKKLLGAFLITVLLLLSFPSEAAAAQQVVVVRNALCNVASCTVDFVSPGFGTPTAAMVFVDNSNTTNNPQTSGQFAIGFWDGTNSRALGSASSDAVDSQTCRMSDDSFFIVAPVCGGTDTTQYTYTVSAITHGVRVTMGTDNTSVDRFATVILFKGVSAKVGTFTPNATQNGTAASASLGFAPEIVFFSTIGATAADTAAAGVYELGFGFAESGGTHRWMGRYINDAATSDVNNILSETRGIGQVASGAVTWSGEVTTWGADSFTMTTRDGASGGDIVFYMALGGDATFQVGTHDSPTATGNQTTNTTNPTDVLLIVQSTAAGTGVQTLLNGTAGFSLGLASHGRQYSHNNSSEDGSAAENENARSTASKIISADTSSGGATSTFLEGSATLNSSNFVVNYTTVDGTARKGFYVAFGDPAPVDPSLTSYSYCQEWTMAAGGASNGVATTTSNPFTLFATSTISTLAATSSGGRIQQLASYTIASTTPVDVAITNGTDCNNDAGSLIPFYFQDYSTTTGEFTVALEYSGISSTTQKNILIYYGSTTAPDLSSETTAYGGLGEVGAWTFGATDLVNDVVDASANSNTGVLQFFTSTTTARGMLGQALTFDGTNDYINVGTSTSLDFRSDLRFSISAWVKGNGAQESGANIVARGTGGGGEEYAIDIAANDKFRFFCRDAAAAATGVITSATGLTGDWQFVTGTFTTSLMSLYINGVLTETDSTPCQTLFNASGHIVSVGSRQLTTGAYDLNFNGSLDEVHIYNQALHAMDQLTIYNNTKSSALFWTFGAEETPGSPGMTQLHYRFRNDDGSESGATWTAAEDTNLTSNFFAGDRKRLRFLISSTGGVATGNITYKLEHASSSCTTWLPVPATSSLTSEHFAIDVSSHFSDGASTTDSAGLSNPDGKTFNAGMAKSTGNSTNVIALTSSQFTELEYTIKPTSNVSVGTTYCFRLTNDGSTTGFTYTAQPQATVSAVAARPTGGGSGAASPAEASATGSVQSGGTAGGGATTTTPGGEGSGSGTPRSGGTPSGGGGGGDTGFLDGRSILASVEASGVGGFLASLFTALGNLFAGMLKNISSFFTISSLASTSEASTKISNLLEVRLPNWWRYL